MSWRTYIYNCDYCGETNESGRTDARFCPGSKCRTAHSRREKKRECASDQMQTEWSDELLASYESLKPFQLHDEIKDMAITHSPAAAGEAVRLAAIILEAITQQKDFAIERLQQQLKQAEAQARQLDTIRDMINETRPAYQIY